MKTMQLNLLAALFAVVCLLTATQATHAENPVNWTFFVETTGGDASWFSPTNLDTGFPNHNYSYTLTQLDLDLTGFGWTSFLSEVAPEDQSGSGSFGALPIVFVDENVAQDELAADILVGIDAAGQGYAHLANVQLGQASIFNVEGIRIGGDINATAVPEPASVLLLSTGAIALLGRRRVRRSA